jgi:PIN domain nuclease of toxin-antitoxin system
VRLLLDTHTLLWWLADDSRLDARARKAIARTSHVAVSAVSAWEIAIKRAIGGLTAPDDLEAELARHEFAPLPITFAHALRIGELPKLHRDPFDRMLVAQAQVEDLVLVTRDREIARYDVATLAA